MKTWTYFAVLLVVLAGAVDARAEVENALVYDFEDDTQGWVTDWGLKQEPQHGKRHVVKGKGALMLEHYFRKDSETIGIKVLLPQACDFTSAEGFEGFTAWIYFPRGSWWEAQLYVSTGDNWEASWGRISQKMKAGWHKLFIGKREIADPSYIRSIGIQIKNYTLSTKAKIYIDDVRAVVLDR